MMDREEEILNSYFVNVSQLNFDKAKEIVERERELFQQTPCERWGTLLSHLPQLIIAEKSYFEFGFLIAKNKGFLRKDISLRSVYESLRLDFCRLEEMAKGKTSATDRLIFTVSQHLRELLTARTDLIDFYERLQVMGNGKQMKYDELLNQIEEIVDKHTLSFPHMVLTSMKTTVSYKRLQVLGNGKQMKYDELLNQIEEIVDKHMLSFPLMVLTSMTITVSLECECICLLLGAQIEMQHWRFLPSLMLLQKASTRISAWERTLQSKESWKLGFGATFLKANPSLPPLFQWLSKLRVAFVTKFSLYFYTTLAQQTSSQDMKTMTAKMSTDYFTRIVSFQRRYDATAVMFVFDTHGLEDFHGHGYHHPERLPENPTDIEPYFIMLSYPLKLLNHMPNITTVLTEKAADLAAMDRPVYSFCPKDQSTYVVSLIDPRISLVVVFDSKKPERDSNITNFVMETSVQLRGNKMFANLKQSAK